MDDNLKPCPFCGQSKADVNEQPCVGAIKYLVICHYCGAETNSDFVREYAIAAWNRRTSPSNNPDLQAIAERNEDNKVGPAIYSVQIEDDIDHLLAHIADLEAALAELQKA